MELNYNVTKQDYVNFNIYHLNHSIIGKVFDVLLFLVFPAWIFIINIVDAIEIKDTSERVGYIVSGVIIALLFAFVFRLVKKILFPAMIKLQLKSGKKNDFIGPQTLILQDEYMEDINPHISSKLPYQTIEKICYGYGCLYLYLGSVKGLIIPISEFIDDNQRIGFLNLLKKKAGLDVIVSRKDKKRVIL